MTDREKAAFLMVLCALFGTVSPKKEGVHAAGA